MAALTVAVLLTAFAVAFTTDWIPRSARRQPMVAQHTTQSSIIDPIATASVSVVTGLEMPAVAESSTSVYYHGAGRQHRLVIEHTSIARPHRDGSVPSWASGADGGLPA
jgi:hypothetical protein